jgi:hypothetical protein
VAAAEPRLRPGVASITDGPYAPGQQFLIVQTGTDGHIYYGLSPYINSGQNLADPNNWIVWFRVPWSTTLSGTAVSITSVGNGVNLAYQSATSNQIWSQHYDPNNGWQQPVLAPGLQTNGAGENVATDDLDQQAIYTVTDSSGNVEEEGLNVNTGQWQPAWNLGSPPSATITQSPTSAFNVNGDQETVAVDSSGHMWTDVRPAGSSNWTGWQRESTGWQTYYAVALSVLGAAIIIIMTGIYNDPWWKAGFQDGNE